MSGCCAGRHHVTGKLEPGCTRRNETFYCIILVQKSPVSFCTTTQGGHAMKKYWKYSKEQLRDVFSTTEQGLSEMQVKKSGKHVGKIYWKREKDPGC